MDGGGCKQKAESSRSSLIGRLPNTFIYESSFAMHEVDRL
jgi:hypothetical protein